MPYEGNPTDPGAGCVPNSSFVSVKNTKQHVLVDAQPGMILPADSAIGLRVGEGVCVMAIRFSPMQSKQPAVNMQWQSESREPWKACGKESSISGSFEVGDTLNLQKYGRFRIRLIVPQTQKHSDWIVLVKD